ncbi:MAG: acyl-CoA dehydrogenase family protein [Pseudomonadota bacterium]
MNFGFTEEQNLLREQVARFMQDTLPLPRVRELVRESAGFSPALWQQMADLGWLGLITPEDRGGIGLKWVDLTVVLEETGRGLSPLPIISQMLSTAAVLRLASSDQQAAWLPAMANGSARCTLALYDEPNWIAAEAISLAAEHTSTGFRLHGRKPFVADAAGADYLMLGCRAGTELGLAVVTAEQVRINPQPVIDETKPMAEVVLDNLHIGPDHFLPMTAEDLSILNDCGAVLATAESVGAAEALLALTSDYARNRVQFGKPIGQYQGVKHRLADMFVDIESFKSLLYYAAWTVDDAPQELARACSMAKGYAADAFAQIGIDGIGLHGAIGFTAEYDAQLYLKRSKWARTVFGDSDFHLDRVAALGGL